MFNYISPAATYHQQLVARVIGNRRKLNTAENPSEFNVDEKLIKDNNWDELNELFKDILI